MYLCGNIDYVRYSMCLHKLIRQHQRRKNNNEILR